MWKPGILVNHVCCAGSSISHIAMVYTRVPTELAALPISLQACCSVRGGTCFAQLWERGHLQTCFGQTRTKKSDAVETCNMSLFQCIVPSKSDIFSLLSTILTHQSVCKPNVPTQHVTITSLLRLRPHMGGARPRQTWQCYSLIVMGHGIPWWSCRKWCSEW